MEITFNPFTGKFDLIGKTATATVYTDAGINAAIDALGTGGGEVYLPEGTYTITGSITIDYNNTTLRGAGWGTILDASAWSAGHIIDLNGSDYCMIKDLKIVGKAGGGNAKDLIYGANSLYTTIKGCYLRNSDRYGINLVTDADYALIIDNFIDNSDQEGIYLNYAPNSIVSNNITYSNGGWAIMLWASSDYSVISNNACDRDWGGIIATGFGMAITGNVVTGTTGADSFYFSDGSDTTLSNNVSNNSGTHGIRIYAGGRISVNNNIIRNPAYHGIYIYTSSQYNVISNNNISHAGNGYDDININASSYNSISSNILNGVGAGNSERGVYLVNSDYSQITGNFFSLHDTNGITLDANSSNNHIEGNNLEGEAIAKVLDSGSSNTVVNAIAGNVSRSIQAGITAGTTQSQGQVPLTKDINEVSVCANVNDVVTLPAAIAGLSIVIFNNGAQTLQVFPASGDNLGAGVDTSITLIAGKNARFISYDATNWEQELTN